MGNIIIKGKYILEWLNVLFSDWWYEWKIASEGYKRILYIWW